MAASTSSFHPAGTARPERPRPGPAPHCLPSSLAAVLLPALAAPAAVLPGVAAEVAVQRTVGAEQPAAELQRYLKCWESTRLGQSLDQCYVAVRPSPDSSR